MKIAVTGGNGFIGGYLIAGLLNAGHQVLALGRSAQSVELIRADVERQVTDFQPADLIAATGDCTALVHLAGRRSVRGESPELVAGFAETGIAMLDGLLSAARVNNFTQVIQASSIALYSPANQRPYRECEVPVPASNYGLGKYFCEQYGDWWSGRHGIPVMHLRIAACYGHGEKKTPALMSLCDRAARKQILHVSNGGSHGIDEIYVEDVVRAIVMGLDSRCSGAYNIGSGRAATVLEIAETANAVFSNEGNLVVEPPTNDGVVNFTNHMAIDKAQSDFGWSPSYSLKSGIMEMRDAGKKQIG